MPQKRVQAPRKKTNEDMIQFMQHQLDLANKNTRRRHDRIRRLTQFRRKKI